MFSTLFKKLFGKKDPAPAAAVSVKSESKQHQPGTTPPKAVVCYKNGQLRGRFDSIKEASRQTGIERAGIQKRLKGARRSAGGYQWKHSEL